MTVSALPLGSSPVSTSREFYQFDIDAGAFGISASAVFRFSKDCNAGSFGLSGNNATIFPRFNRSVLATTGVFSTIGESTLRPLLHHVILGTVGSIAYSGTSTGKATRPLTLTAGAFTITGTATLTKVVRKYCTAGAFSIVGSTTLKVSRILIATVGARLTAGSTATVFAKYNRKITSDAGTITLTGLSLPFKRGVKSRVDSGIFSDIGASSFANRLTNFAVGTFSLNGATAVIRPNRKLPNVDTGVYGINGNSANLNARFHRKITTLVGSISTSGATATVRAIRIFPTFIGHVSLNGATLTFGATINRTYTVNPGARSLTGANATLIQKHYITGLVGAFSETGNDLTGKIGLRLPIGVGQFTHSYVEATLIPTRNRTYAINAGTFNTFGQTGFFGKQFFVDSGAYTFAGESTLRIGARLSTGIGSLTLTGLEANFTLYALKVLTGNAGAIGLDGATSPQTVERFPICDPGSFSLDGESAKLKRAYSLVGASAAYGLSFSTATLPVVRRFTGNAGSIARSAVLSYVSAARKAPGNAGSFALSGKTALLGYFAVGLVNGWIGEFELNGATATEKVERFFACSPGAHSIAGANATIRWNSKLITTSAVPSAFNVSYSSATIVRGRGSRFNPAAFNVGLIQSTATLRPAVKLKTSIGEIGFSGSDADLVYFSRNHIYGEHTDISLIGFDAEWTLTRAVDITLAYHITGTAQLTKVLTFPCDEGAIALDGKDCQYKFRLFADKGVFETTLYMNPKIDRVIVLEAKPFRILGKQATGTQGHSLEITLGEFATTGKTASFTYRLFPTLSLDAGTYASDYSKATFRKDVNLRCLQMSPGYRSTWATATLTPTRHPTFVCNPGTFGLVGFQTSRLRIRKGFPAATAALSIEGSADFNLKGASILGKGAFTIEGTSQLTLAWNKTGATRAFTIGGQGALRANRLLALESGSVASAGNAAVFARAAIFPATKGTFSRTGSANLVLSWQKPAEQGQFRILGTGRMARGPQIGATAGVHAISGASGRTIAARRLSLTGGAFLSVGNTAQVSANRRLVCAPGVFAVSAPSATMKIAVRGVVAPLAYSMAGCEATFQTATRTEIILEILPGSYAATSADSRVSKGIQFFALHGSLASIGTTIDFVIPMLADWSAAVSDDREFVMTIDDQQFTYICEEESA